MTQMPPANSCHRAVVYHWIGRAWWIDGCLFCVNYVIPQIHASCRAGMVGSSLGCRRLLAYATTVPPAFGGANQKVDDVGALTSSAHRGTDSGSSSTARSCFMCLTWEICLRNISSSPSSSAMHVRCPASECMATLQRFRSSPRGSDETRLPLKQ